MTFCEVRLAFATRPKSPNVCKLSHAPLLRERLSRLT